MLSKILEFINRTFVFQFKKFVIAPTYWQAGLIIFLIFLLLMSLARIRYLYVHWSLGKSSLSFLFWGFILAIIMEGFFLLGGKTILTSILGIKNLPKPINTAIDEGRKVLERELGIPKKDFGEDEEYLIKEIEYNYSLLPPEKTNDIKNIICKEN